MNGNWRREFFWASQGNESAYQGIPQGKSVSMNIAKNSDSTDVICYLSTRSQPASAASRATAVGWVERSETHRSESD
jgi:hypothetical protein